MGFCPQTSYTVCMLQRLFKTIPETTLLLLALIPLCVVRVLPSLHQQLGTLGYDYGFYRYAAAHADFTGNLALTGVHGGYAHILLSLFHTAHIPPDAGLTASLYVAAVILGIAVFYVLQTHSRTAAVCGCLLLASSIIQSQVYTMFLWKTVLALPLLVVGLWALQTKKYVILTGTVLALLITHRTSVILLLLTIGAWEIFRVCKNKNWRLFGLYVLGFGCVVGLYHSALHQFWHTLFNPSNANVAEGIFPIGNGAIFTLAIFILLACLGSKALIKQKQLGTVILFTGLCGVWVLLHLPFFHRVYIYFDLGLLILGGTGLATFWHSLRHAALKGLAGILAAALLFSNMYFAVNSSSLIAGKEIQEIGSFSPSEPAPFVLAVSADDAPWLLGYLQHARLAAPGLFEDIRSESAWQKFWYGEERHIFLSGYPKPLYLYDRSFKLSGPITQCLTKVSPNFSKFTCE